MLRKISQHSTIFGNNLRVHSHFDDKDMLAFRILPPEAFPHLGYRFSLPWPLYTPPPLFYPVPPRPSI